MHTFRELILGAYLGSRGFKVRHDHVVENKTPDWCILDDKLTIIGMVELTNFHIDRITETEIKRKIEANQLACFWRDGNKDNIERLYSLYQEKSRHISCFNREVKSILRYIGIW
jgi:hypothetical protein